MQRNGPYNPLREDFRFHGQVQDPYPPSQAALPSYHPLTLQEYRAREDQQRDDIRMREEKEAVWQRDIHRERERSRSASPNPAPHHQHPAQSSYQPSAAEYPYGPVRASSQGPVSQSYTAYTTQEAGYNPYPATSTGSGTSAGMGAGAGSSGMKTVRIYDAPTAAEELSARRYGVRSADNDSDAYGDEDKENRRLMELAVTERLERERVSEEAMKKAKSDRLEMDKMKYDMEKQRRSMELEQDEWRVMRERREREDAFEEDQALLRKREAEEQDIKSVAKSTEERLQREREESMSRNREIEREREKEIEKEKSLEIERERVREKIEVEKKRTVEIAAEAESRRKFFEDEEKRFKEISESKNNAAIDRDLERDMDDVIAKESVLSELKDRKKEIRSRTDQDSSGDDSAGKGNDDDKDEDKDEDEMEESVEESRDTYASKISISVPLSVPNAKYVQQSVEFRDSLDSPGMRGRGPWQQQSKITGDVTILKSTSEGPGAEDSVDSSRSTLSGRDNGPETNPLSPDLGQRLRGRSGSEQGGEEALPRIAVSTDSDAWLDNNKEERERERGGKENAILKFDGLTTRELLHSSYQAQEGAQADAIEEDDGENEEDRMSRERASADQEKKVADDRAIQDARASVIARRKQKMEREAVAASLSCLPVNEPERVKPPAVSASMPSLSASKFKSYSSSEESVDSPDDKALNKSKSVLGVRLTPYTYKD